MQNTTRNTIMAMSIAGAAALASAQDVSITIKNMMASDSFFFTPVWVGAHDGSFDVYDTGTLASGWPGITEIAEGGDTSVLGGRFGSDQPAGSQTTITAVAFGGDAPVFSPGESTTVSFNAGDPTVNRYFSFASMIIPSNDLFFGNDGPMGYELFDAAGNFNGPITIDIYGMDVRDNGTEVNDAFGGAAFSTNGGMGVDEMNPIREFFTDNGDAGYLQSFVGSMTANGATIGSTFGSGDLIARITIVPAPASVALLGLGGLAAARRRRC